MPIPTKFVQGALNNPEFIKPNNPERSFAKKNRNLDLFKNIYSAVIDKSNRSTSEKLQLSGGSQGTVRKFYDDDIVRSIGEEFNDRLRAMILVGDIIRFLRLSFTRKELTPEEFVEKGLNMITSKRRIFRQDIAELTSVDFNHLNNTLPFMNGGPAGENWNKSANGFYDWIDSKSCESILGIELGFKADSYGLEVSNKLVEKKKKNPAMCINLLIDGFVSVLMQKPPSSLTDFEHNTITMIYQMRKAGIDVYVNDSWNPLSTDFLAANHIKLWIFDGEIAFYGGIGIESQFRNTLYDEMDLVQGPFVATLTTMALLLITNQKNHDDIDDEQKRIEEQQQQPIYNMNRELLKRLFIKDSSRAGNVSMRISMDVPGYIQDAQHDYVSLLTRRDVDEIYIMAPYFSDHKVAKALVVAADRLFMRYYRDIEDTKVNRIKSKAFDLLKVVNKPSHYAIQRKRPIGKEVTSSGDIYNSPDNKKRIHVIFPKKQENHIIEEVSRYYAYYLRNNPLVETRQFYAEVGSEKYEMLHAKQMIVVLRNPSRNWTKYVKFGGSYNPAGRAQNMWEINAISFNGAWHQSDESAFTTKEKNPIKEYLESVMKIIVEKYSQPFPWGQSDFKLSFQDRISMAIARSLWF